MGSYSLELCIGTKMAVLKIENFSGGRPCLLSGKYMFLLNKAGKNTYLHNP